MRRFFIYSTPRSGSAWLSNFLTYGGSFCQHEPLADGRLVFTHHEVSGAIDTGAAFVGFVPPDDCAVYHLYRDEVAVKRSLKSLGLPVYDLSRYSQGFEYDRLFDVDYLEELWTDITSLPFDRARAEMLVEMNVQRSLPGIARRLRRV